MIFVGVTQSHRPPRGFNPNNTNAQRILHNPMVVRTRLIRVIRLGAIEIRNSCG